MGDFVEYSAKNKSEAITKACIDQGVSSDELEIQVVSEGSSGFFGIGSKPAIIRRKSLLFLNLIMIRYLYFPPTFATTAGAGLHGLLFTGQQGHRKDGLPQGAISGDPQQV